MQIEKWMHSDKNQFIITHLSFCPKTLQAYVEKFAVNNDISKIRFHYVKPDLYGI